MGKSRGHGGGFTYRQTAHQPAAPRPATAPAITPETVMACAEVLAASAARMRELAPVLAAAAAAGESLARIEAKRDICEAALAAAVAVAPFAKFPGRR